MDKPGLSEQLRYWFDNWMAKGTMALMALLAAATLLFVIVIAGIVMLLHTFPGDAKNASFWDVLWGNLMRTLDPGTMGGDEGWGFRVMMLIVTIGGLVMVASLIGIISSAFDSKVEELRKGRSRVLEHDHTVILGWSEKLFPIIREICIANESRRRAAIVVLADRDKVEMDDEIRSEVPNPGKTKIICRSGDPMNLTELEMASPHAARSIIVLSPDDAEDADLTAIKTALALTNNPHRREEEYHIVAELREPSNLEAAKLAGRDEVHWILASDLISRMTVQTCRQSGLSVVYTEFLDFDGDEIYFTSQPELYGQTYAEIQFAFVDSAVMGLVSGGESFVNPPGDRVYGNGDEIIVVAEDDSTIKLGKRGAPDLNAISTLRASPLRPERTLFLGFNSALQVMLTELGEYVAPGSQVMVVADIGEPDLVKPDSVEVTFQRGATTSRAVLDELDVATYDHIVVLAYKDLLDNATADARTLITLLHLRDIAEKLRVELNVVSEMLDDRNRELAEVTQADDFIVSDRLISLMLSQVSENRQLTAVFDTLFASAGSEVYLRPAELYIRPGAEADFYTVLEAAQRKGETAIGFRIASQAHDSDKQYGITVNPNKAERRSFSPGDKIIVLAEDEEIQEFERNDDATFVTSVVDAASGPGSEPASGAPVTRRSLRAATTPPQM